MAPYAVGVIEVELSPTLTAANDPVIGELTDLVNRAYVVAERGLWKEGVTRTTRAETAEAIARQEVLVARHGGRIVGAVRTRLLDGVTGWFGALAVDETHAGRGIGGLLVAAAEGHASEAGASSMQLELLVPAAAHEHVEMLTGWYTRLGYRRTDVRDLAEVDPAAVPFLLMPCHAAVMRKDLANPVG